MKHTKRIRIVLNAITAAAVIIVGVCAGSVFVHPISVFKIFGNALFGTGLDGVPDSSVSIIMTIRFPRVLLGFLTGAALSVCGTAVQSVLRNPLASPFTLGVSSGASLGAGIVIACELTFLGRFTLHAAGLVFGVAAMFLMVAFASKIDRTLQGSTIVLTGMVLSLFVNGIVSVMANAKDEKYKQIMKWQTGSFSGKWEYVIILAAVLAVCLVYFLIKSRELDLLTFGDEQAQSAGVSTRREKALILLVTAVLSGTAVAFAGVIGFIDLVSPHVARRFFGAEHKLLVPMAALIGGTFMVLCYLAARTGIPPNELPG
ncbi:MAG: iron ABC transporter permease, partial [Oscillospiraceae bacterium]|nr:iron ABC transporter permease [Oscillospiraceae bacterium]